MNCRKCGAKRITRRRAGVFVCRHCGVQPGDAQMDRGGKPAMCATRCAREDDPAASPCYICAGEDNRVAAEAARAGGTMPLLPPDPTAIDRRMGDYELMRLRGD